MWKQLVLYGLVVAFGLMWMTRRGNRRKKVDR
jgi:hypothetical protein